jgi:hypothetical protein
MLNQMLLQNWRSLTTVVMGLIFLSLTPLVLNAPNLYISLALVVFTMVKTIEMMQGLNFSKNQELKLKSWTVNIEEDPETGDYILCFPPELLEQAGWKEGDNINWIDQKDGSWLLKKVDTTSEKSV